MQSNYRWVIVAAGALLGCVAAGSMFSLAVFLQPIAEATGWSRAGLSGTMTVNFLSMGAAGFFWGWLTDRFGPRPALLSGALLLGHDPRDAPDALHIRHGCAAELHDQRFHSRPSTLSPFSWSGSQEARDPAPIK